MTEIPRYWRNQKERYNLVGHKYEDGSVSLFHGLSRPRYYPGGQQTPNIEESAAIEAVPINEFKSTGELVLTADSGVIFQQQD